MGEKKDLLDFIKLRNSCSLENTVEGMKRQATDGEKIFAKHISDKSLVCRIHKEHS